MCNFTFWMMCNGHNIAGDITLSKYTEKHFAGQPKPDQHQGMNNSITEEEDFMFQRCCDFWMIFRTEKSPEYFLNSTKSWYMNQLRFLPGEKNWHWWERLQASYTHLKGILWRESSNRLGFHKLPNVSERSSSQRWNLTSLWLFLAQCIPHTASSLFTRWP